MGDRRAGRESRGAELLFQELCDVRPLPPGEDPGTSETACCSGGAEGPPESPTRWGGGRAEHCRRGSDLRRAVPLLLAAASWDELLGADPGRAVMEPHHF